MKRVISCGVLLLGVLALALFFFFRGSVPGSLTSALPASKVLPTRLSVAPNHPATAQLNNRSVAAATAFSPVPAGRTNVLAPVLAFAGWAGQFASNNPAFTVMQGENLARARREAMLDLIQTDPARALTLAVPYAWRQAFPPAITQYFEEQVDGRGNFNVAVGTDFSSGNSTTFRTVQVAGRTFQAFVYGRRVAEVSQTAIPLHGIALDGKMAVSSEPLRPLTVPEATALDSTVANPADVICSVSGQPASSRGAPVYAESGGGVLCFCGEDHYKLVNQQWALAESGGSIESGPGAFSPGASATAANDAWTHGNKNVLYMRVNFPDDLSEPISEAEAYAAMDGVNTYYTANSYDLSWLTTTVTPVLTLPQIKAYYTPDPTLLLADARAAALAAGYDTASFDRDIVAFDNVPGYTFGGLAYVHGKGVWLQNGGMGVGVTAHELGHNYGLWHANFWNALTNYSGIGPGTNLEYGNIYDTMGSGGVAYFNAIHKNILDWLKADAVQTITTNGVYRIYPFDVPGSERVDGRMYAAALKKDALRNYWLEFRSQYTANAWLENGLLVYWSPWLFSNGGAQLVDTTPGSPNQSDTDSRDDAAVVIGRTFNDQAAGVHVTPLQRGLTGTEPFIDFQVNLGAFPGNQPPVLAVQVDHTNVPLNTLVHFHATASDPDGDALAYAWTFDDLTFSTNDLDWASKAFSTPGDHFVRCVVSDMKGGEASASVVVTVGAPGGTQITGYITDPNGVPLEGVLVGNGSLSADTFIGGYTDSSGRYVLANISGPFNLNAYEGGYTFTNAMNWANPIDATNSLEDINFTGYPLPVLSITVDTNSVAETDNSLHEFTITSTGSTNHDQTVSINLSGSAVDGTDYHLTPDFSGLSTITIPAGTNRVSFDFRAASDPLVQGPQTVTITVLDDTNLNEPSYALGPLAEATITIVDPNPPASPTVNVFTPTPDIGEEGMDNGQLVFTRTGSLQNNLLVYYAVSGTAAAGVNYVPLPGVVLIPAGQSSTTVPLVPIDDEKVDPDQTVTINLTGNPAYSTGTSPSTQIIILNEDYTTVSVTSTSDTASMSSPGVFTVQRDGDLSSALVVNYNVGGTAIPGVEYAALSGSVTIPAGAASANVSVTALSGIAKQGNQSVTLSLTNNPNYDVIIPGSATVNVLDSDIPAVSVKTTVDNISEQGNRFGQFTFSRSGTSGDLPVYFAVSGTAAGGVDYVPLASPVVIPNGQSSVTVNVIPFQDLYLEPTETVEVTLQPDAGYNINDSTATALLNILDDGVSQVVAAGFCFPSSAFPESQSPGIAVALSVTSSVPVSVDYTVVGGTAPASRYSLPQGTLTIPAGINVGFVPLQINNDTTIEPPQTVEVALFNPVNATLDGIRIHTYTILDDDTAAVSVAATVPSALAAGPVNGNFRISRAGPTNASEQVQFEITGTASAPNDYVTLGTSAVIPAGAAFVDLPVVPVNQQMLVPTQTVVLTLTGATNGSIVSPSAATVSIIDNDTNVLPGIAVTSTNHPYAYAGPGGGPGQFLFTRSGPANHALTISFVIGGTAANGVDYQSITNVVTIPAGQSNAVVSVVPVNQHVAEVEKTVVVTLVENGSYHADYLASATVTLQNDSQNVWIDASDFTAAKPDTAGGFTFSRFGTTNQPVTVMYTIGGTATNGSDYVFITNSIVIPAGELTATLPILPVETHLVEGPRTVVLTLLANSNYGLGTPVSATVTINDDEPQLTITALETNIFQGSGSNGVFRLTRYGDPKYDFTAYLVVGGTAAYGVDYTAFATNVYFTCGVTSIDLSFTATNELAAAGVQTLTADLVPNPAYTILWPSNAFMNITEGGPGQTPLVTITNPATAFAFLEGTNEGLVLQGSVLDGNPTNAVTWSEVSGPDTLVFDNTNLVDTAVSFSEPGVYVLQLTATNGLLQGIANVTIVVAADQLAATNSLHWPFDEGLGTNVADVSGSGRDGEFSGFPAWTTNGVIGDALVFQGTNDCVRQTGGTNLLNGLKAFSISVWIKPMGLKADSGFVTGDDANMNPTFSLSMKSSANCGDYTNVVEAVIPTTQGVFYRDSASNVLRPNQWQNIIVTWTNGGGPNLYINGQLDQPAASFAALSGVLTNCPQFIVGRGPANSPSWNGAVDDVRVYSRVLDPLEIIAIADNPVTNHAPIVSAGPDVQVQTGIPVTLTGTVTDDGLPNPPDQVTTEWTYLGTNDVVIPDPASLTNTFVFSTPGDYIFRLSASDGQLTSYSDVTVTVLPPIEVSIYNSGGDAYELGPVSSQYTLMRTGDTNELEVYVGFSGTASNGVNYVEITNEFTFPAGVDTIDIPLTPILDYHIKGDQAAIATVLTNIAYTVDGGPASITVHDSPYGYWSIANFTLEELTFPGISGAGADYDHDGLVNFVEYAFNLDPKTPNPNPAFQYDFEVSTNDGLNHLTLTYTRLLPPRVVAYGVFVSNDLLNWNTGTNYVQELSSTDDGNGLTETVKAQVVAPVSASTNLFVTIRVGLEQVTADGD